MRVGVITSTYPRHADDYAVPWMREGLIQLSGRGVDVEVFAPSYRGLGDHVLDGIPVRRFRYFPAPMERLTHEEGATNKIGNPLFQLLTLPYLACGVRAASRWAKTRSLDVIHVHWPFPHGLFAEAVRRVSGIPVVAMCHGAGLSLAHRKPWVRALLRGSLRRADALLANSEDTALRMRALVERDVTVIPFGTTVDASPRSQRTDGPPTLLFTGRLIQRKGVEYLIEALPRILAKREVRVVITGDGNRRTSIENSIRAHGLEGVVEMCGFVSNERLRDLYATSDVYVLPAVHDDGGDTEGLGVPLIEAALHALPIVATGIGGIVDVVKDRETGLWAPERDPAGIAAAVLELLDDPELGRRLGEAARQHVRARFDWDSITDDLIAVYDGVLSCTSKRPFAARSA